MEAVEYRIVGVEIRCLCKESVWLADCGVTPIVCSTMKKEFSKTKQRSIGIELSDVPGMIVKEQHAVEGWKQCVLPDQVVLNLLWKPTFGWSQTIARVTGNKSSQGSHEYPSQSYHFGTKRKIAGERLGWLRILWSGLLQWLQLLLRFFHEVSRQ